MSAHAHPSTTLLLTLGATLLVGLLVQLIGRRIKLPRVTLLLLAGVAIGPAGFDLLPAETQAWFPPLANVALVMVGFLLGSEFALGRLQQRWKEVGWVALSVTVATALSVGLGLWWLGADPRLAIVLAAIAPATDPAAVLDVVKESRADGPLTRVLLGVVAIDDFFGLLLFSVLFAFAGGAEVPLSETLATGAWEVGGSVALGIALGVPMAFLSGRLSPGEPTREEALGMVLVCCGLAQLAGVSFLMAAMVMGTVVVNLADHHERAFHEIEAIEDPFLVLFFVLSGASLEIDALSQVGWIAVAYVGLRLVGRLVGGTLGGGFAHLDRQRRAWAGPALLPQAGVALGLSLIVQERLPELSACLPVVLVATVLFEVVGPLVTRIALTKVGEVPGPR